MAATPKLSMRLKAAKISSLRSCVGTCACGMASKKVTASATPSVWQSCCKAGLSTPSPVISSCTVLVKPLCCKDCCSKANASMSVSMPYAGASVLTVPIVMGLAAAWAMLALAESARCTAGQKRLVSTPNGVIKICGCACMLAACCAMQWLVEAMAVAAARFFCSRWRWIKDLAGKSYTSLPQTESNSGRQPLRRAMLP